MITYRADEPGTARRTCSRSESRTAQAQEPAPAAASTALSGTSEARSSEAGLTRTIWMWRRLLGGPTVLIILVWRLGTGPFLDAVRTINGWSLAAATGIAALTTVSCTWRWSLVARSLDVGMPMGAAVPHTTGRSSPTRPCPAGCSATCTALYATAATSAMKPGPYELLPGQCSAGKVVQIVLAITVLLVLPSPVRSSMPVVRSRSWQGAGRRPPVSGAALWRAVQIGEDLAHDRRRTSVVDSALRRPGRDRRWLTVPTPC
jgi:hypothetical protein